MRRRLPLVVIALCYVAVASALADPGPIKIVSEGQNVAASDDARKNANCPGAQKAIGGGFKSPIGPAFAQVYPEISRPKADDAWSVGVYNNSFSESRRFKVFAICQKNPGALKRETKSKIVDPGRTTVVAECDPDYKLVGGGFDIPGERRGVFDGTVTTSESARFTEAWIVTIDSISDGIRIRAYAICRKRRGTKTVEEGQIEVDPLSSKTTIVDCPAGKPDVVGGGFSTPDNLITVASWPASDDSWGVRVANPSGGATGIFNASALCQ